MSLVSSSLWWLLARPGGGQCLPPSSHAFHVCVCVKPLCSDSCKDTHDGKIKNYLLITRSLISITPAKTFFPNQVTFTGARG